MFKRQWWRMSIDRKVQSFAAVIVFIILVSAGFAMFTMNYSLRDYGQLLDENRACQSFMKAMEEEGLAFDGYVSAGTETARDMLEKVRNARSKRFRLIMKSSERNVMPVPGISGMRISSMRRSVMRCCLKVRTGPIS